MTFLSPKYNIKETQLENGLTIISEKIDGAGTFALGITSKVGTRHENGFNPGIAHFMEHAVFRNSVKKNSRQIASQFESVGAYTNAFTTHEFTCFYVRAMKKHFKKTFNLLSEIVLQTDFKYHEIEKERNIIIEEIKSYQDDPEESIIEHGDRLIFGDDPVGNPITGTEESVRKISVDELRDFHEKKYSPENLIITFSGDIEHHKLEEIINKKLQFGKNNYTEKKYTVPYLNKSKELFLESNFQQSHILFAKALKIENNKDNLKFILFNMLLGDGMSSRLYQNIRERYGLAYTIYSSLNFYSDCVSFYIYAGTDIATESKIITLIIKELNKLIKNGINEAELKRAKEQVKTNIYMNDESISNRMQSLIKQHLFKYEILDRNEKIDIIDSITKNEINEFILTHFEPTEFNKVVYKGNPDQ
jgi:predicted Zn-dependent peptidase